MDRWSTTILAALALGVLLGISTMLTFFQPRIPVGEMTSAVRVCTPFGGLKAIDVGYRKLKIVCNSGLIFKITSSERMRMQ